jgi:hypothetical protein
MKKYRNEWKYCCTNCDLKLLENRLKEVLPLDSNAQYDGKYYIHSLYFDDYKDICARDNEAGISKRFKWRIRYYNNASDNIYLEKKEKLYGRCNKRKCTLTNKEFQAIMMGDVSCIFWNTDIQLLKEFCVDIMCRQFRPKVIIDYERIAYIEDISNIRITLDTNISASYEFDKFLTGEYQNFPLQLSDCHILEVKFDDILPSYIKNIVCSFGFVQTSFSKYYVGRKKLEEVIG